MPPKVATGAPAARGEQVKGGELGAAAGRGPELLPPVYCPPGPVPTPHPSAPRALQPRGLADEVFLPVLSCWDLETRNNNTYLIRKVWD